MAISRTFNFSHQLCHVLTAELCQLVPAGEPIGLFAGEECVHSAFRVAHTETYLDANGCSEGREGLQAKATPYMRSSGELEWRSICVDAVRRMAPRVDETTRRHAHHLALDLLRSAAEQLPATDTHHHSL